MINSFSHLTSVAQTDQGCTRKNNEDAYGIFSDVAVFCVADGMGGAEDGEIASQAVIDGLAKKFESVRSLSRPLCGKVMQEWMVQILNEVSAWIYRRSAELGIQGTGTTFVGVSFDPSQPDVATALHAGDSRLYRLREKELSQITQDHSPAALAGVKDEKELNPMFRGIVMRAVGVKETVALQCTPFDVKKGDLILLCSDGLTRMVPDKLIARILSKARSDEKAACELIACANKNGGLDNITVVTVRVGPLPLPHNDCLLALPFGDAPVEPAVASNETQGQKAEPEETRRTSPSGPQPVTPSTFKSGELLPFESSTPTPTPHVMPQAGEVVREDPKRAEGVAQKNQKRPRFKIWLLSLLILVGLSFVIRAIWPHDNPTQADPCANEVL